MEAQFSAANQPGKSIFYYDKKIRSNMRNVFWAVLAGLMFVVGFLMSILPLVKPVVYEAAMNNPEHSFAFIKWWFLSIASMCVGGGTFYKSWYEARHS
ncbi:hypothetical protein [Janthinobacterium sp. HH102]|uniref:hypothetical protein n=1 Tax=Janthinobacterium sp. HH102 TaxID=1537274 RepID=UPI001113149F|nr:hypothetical protein [Janthinobacterium sp. HH102]